MHNLNTLHRLNAVAAAHCESDRRALASVPADEINRRERASLHPLVAESIRSIESGRTLEQVRADRLYREMGGASLDMRDAIRGRSYR